MQCSEVPLSLEDCVKRRHRLVFVVVASSVVHHKDICIHLSAASATAFAKVVTEPFIKNVPIQCLHYTIEGLATFKIL